MNEESQKKLIQDIVSEVTDVLPKKWLEVILSYKVEDTQSEFVNSYIINDGKKNIEKSIPSIDCLDEYFRKLRDHISGDNRQLFSKCIFHFKATGELETKYSYEPIDWNEFPGWNFKVNG